MKQLTELAIRNLPTPPKGSVKHFDPSLPGFGVRCSARSKSFFVQFGEKRRLKTLGKWPDLSLREARQQARQVLVAPPPMRRKVCFDDARDDDARDGFLADCASRLRPSTVERYRYALKPIAAKTLEQVPKTISDPHQVATLKAFFNWCIDRDMIDHNPFLRRKVMIRQRDRVLSDDEVARIMAYDHAPYSDIVKLLCLTGQRRSQISGFSMDWIDGDTITFPATVEVVRPSRTVLQLF